MNDINIESQSNRPGRSVKGHNLGSPFTDGERETQNSDRVH